MKYMLCTDGSLSSSKALDHLIKSATSNDSVVIFSSYPIPQAYILEEELIITSPQENAEENAERRRAANSIAEKAKEILLSGNKHLKPENITIEIRGGEPRDVIIDIAKEQKIECIVLGSRGLGAISRLLLGSVSNYVVNHAECSVLIVR